METETLELVGATPGLLHSITALRFGSPGRGPKAYIQAALHADEIPAMLVAQHLRSLFTALEDAGQMLGEVVLVPYANPLGLAQEILGSQQGRFDCRDGINFNRNFPELGASVAQALEGQLGPDAEDNLRLVRQALRQAAQALGAQHPVADMKRRLLQWAVDADIVLDLHCDAEAAVHLYGLTPQADLCAELGALIGARAILMATESGDSPFDEACSRPWLQVQQRYPGSPVPLACFSTTVELRGQADTDHELAGQDAKAIVEFLRRRGVLSGQPAPLAAALCEPTPLASSEPVTASCAGVLVFRACAGQRVAAGAHIADIVDIDTGEVHALHAQSEGVLYARIATRWARAGQRVAKVAGTTLQRTGKLLSA